MENIDDNKNQEIKRKNDEGHTDDQDLKRRDALKRIAKTTLGIIGVSALAGSSLSSCRYDNYYNYYNYYSYYYYSYYYYYNYSSYYYNYYSYYYYNYSDYYNYSNYYNYSDLRLKKNVQNIENALDKITRLRGVSWEWNNNNIAINDKQKIGFVAQEVKEVMPEIVDNNNGYYTIEYASVIAMLVEAVKEQQKKIDVLEKKMYCN